MIPIKSPYVPPQAVFQASPAHKFHEELVHKAEFRQALDAAMMVLVDGLAGNAMDALLIKGAKHYRDILLHLSEVRPPKGGKFDGSLHHDFDADSIMN